MNLFVQSTNYCRDLSSVQNPTNLNKKIRNLIKVLFSENPAVWRQTEGAGERTSANSLQVSLPLCNRGSDPPREAAKKVVFISGPAPYPLPPL